MSPETKKFLLSFLWKLLTALLAALGGAGAAHAAVALQLI